VIANNAPSSTEVHVENVIFRALDDERIYDSHAFRGQAKLATTLFVKELSRRLEVRGVAANAFHSGTSGNRNPARHAIQRLIHLLLRYFTRSPAQRAATPALLAASPLVAGITGEYWSDCQIFPESPLFMDAGLAKQLWDVSAQIAAMMFGLVNSPWAAGLRRDSLLSNVD
jgi:WW domain-containing oxidoreductase